MCILSKSDIARGVSADATGIIPAQMFKSKNNPPDVSANKCPFFTFFPPIKLFFHPIVSQDFLIFQPGVKFLLLKNKKPRYLIFGNSADIEK